MILTYSPKKFTEAKKMEKNGLKLIAGQVADCVLNEGIIDFSCKFWTNTIIVYNPPYRPFEDVTNMNLRSSLISINTNKFKGLRNHALIVDDYEIRFVGNYFQFFPKTIEVIQNFPKEDGWFGVKDGVPIESGDKSRYLWRISGPYIGPIVRSSESSHRSDIFLNKKIFDSFSIVTYL